MLAWIDLKPNELGLGMHLRDSSKDIIKRRQGRLFVALTVVLLLALSAFQGSYAESVGTEPYWQEYNKAKALVQQHDYQKALDILTPLLAKQENFRVYILIAEIYSAQKKPTLALQYYKKAYQLSKGTGPAENNKLALFGLARTELALRNARAAQEYYNELLKYNLSPDDKKTVELNLQSSRPVLEQQQFNEQIQKIQAYINQGKGSEAYSLVKPLLNHRTSRVYSLAGASLALMEKPKEALGYYQQALQFAKAEKNVTFQKMALSGIARMQLALKEVTEVQKTYQELRSLQLSSTDEQSISEGMQQINNLQLEIKLQEIRDLLNKGEKNKAQQQIKPLLVHTTSSVYLLAGDILASMEKPEKALDYYKQTHSYAIAEKNQTYQQLALFAQARMYLAMHKGSDARQIYQRLLQMNLNAADHTVAKNGLERADAVKLLPPGYKGQSQSSKEIETIQKLIDKGEGKRALELVQPLLTSNKQALVYLLAAQGKALTDQPHAALTYYQQAYVLAIQENKEVLNRIALFGIARMQVASGQLEAARKTYLQILQTKLVASDRLLAQKGLNKIDGLKRQSAHNELIQTINAYINSGQGSKAYELILPLIKKFNQPIYYTLAAKSMIASNNPHQAMIFYNLAYQRALRNKDIEAQREALTGIATMQMWLDQYVRATKTYRLLLTYPLNPKEYELAKAGLVKSYAYRGRTYTAFDEIPWDLRFTSPHMVIAALQTTLWTGQGDIAKDLFFKYQSVLNEIKPNTHLSRDLKNIEWQLALETAPYQLMPEFYYFKDSEDFTIQKGTLRARRYWSQQWQSRVALNYLKYAQYGDTVNGKSFLFNQTWRPSRHFILDGEVLPTSLNNNWSPTQWGSSALFIPNDFISFNAAIREELIEGFPAILNHNFYHSYSVGGALQPASYVNLKSTIYQLNMNDTNTRNGYNFYGTLTFLPTIGVYTGYSIRSFTSKFRSPFYFSPNYYSNNLYLLGISHPLGSTWRYFGEGGYGSQSIKNLPDSVTGTGPSWFYKCGLRGPIRRNIFFDIQYGNYRLASNFVDSQDYRFHTILTTLTFSLD